MISVRSTSEILRLHPTDLNADTAITEGELTDTHTAHRLAWNLCAGTIGAAHASASLREDVDLATRIEDTVTAHTEAATHPDWESTARRQHEGNHLE